MVRSFKFSSGRKSSPVSSASALSLSCLLSASSREPLISSSVRSDLSIASSVASSFDLPSCKPLLRFLIILTALKNPTAPLIPASKNKPSITFLNRPSNSPSSSPFDAKNSVTGFLRVSFILIKLESLSSCASNTKKSAAAPAATLVNAFSVLDLPNLLTAFNLRSSAGDKSFVFLAILSAVFLPTLPESFAKVPTRPNCPATGMNPVMNCAMPSTKPPAMVLERPKKRSL